MWSWHPAQKHCTKSEDLALITPYCEKVLVQVLKAYFDISRGRGQLHLSSLYSLAAHL